MRLSPIYSFPHVLLSSFPDMKGSLARFCQCTYLCKSVLSGWFSRSCQHLSHLLLKPELLQGTDQLSSFPLHCCWHMHF